VISWRSEPTRMFHVSSAALASPPILGSWLSSGIN
jgi:hypothetical protein